MIEPGASSGSGLKRKRDEHDQNDDIDRTPAATILLALPVLVGYPPDHPLHVPGLRASLKALRRCTGLEGGAERDGARKRVKGDGGVGSAAGETMTPEVEVRAWMALAEVGMMVVRSRCNRWGEADESFWQWTTGVEQDIDTALLKGLALASTLPSLRTYKDPLTLLSARAATPKRAIKILSTMLSSATSNPPTKYTYEAYLALADLHLYPVTQGGKPNLGAGLHVLSQMRTRAEEAGDVGVARLALVAALRARVVLCTDGMVEDVGQETLQDSLCAAETEVGITYAQEAIAGSRDKQVEVEGQKVAMADVSNRGEPALTPASHASSSPFVPPPPLATTKIYPPTPHPLTPVTSTPSIPISTPTPEQPYIHHLRAQLLFLGVALFTHRGEADLAAKRLTKVHAILDAGLLENESEGCFCGLRARGGVTPRAVPTVDKLGTTLEEIPDSCPCTRSYVLPIPLGRGGEKTVNGERDGDWLMVRTTHPRVMFELAFLVSSVARRDVVGRKPRRMVFAVEGLRAGEELGVDVAFPVWSTIADVKDTELRLAEVRADLLCELVAIAIMRSEFLEAEQRLAELVAHTRNFGVFESFAPRIALHHAHLAHAQGLESRAISCYDATIRSALPGSYIHTSARAGLLGLRMGVSARDRHLFLSLPSPNTPPPDTPPPSLDVDPTLLPLLTNSLTPLAHILSAQTLPIVRAKEQLKLGLDSASRAQDNYIRALGVAMCAARYMHTAEAHAGVMLGTVRGLAAGMGAVEVKGKEGESKGEKKVGNAVLGLWVGLRLYELYKRAGDTEQAKKQEGRNKKLLKAVAAIRTPVALSSS